MASPKGVTIALTPSKTAEGNNNYYRKQFSACCGSDYTDSVVADIAGWGITLSITDEPEETGGLETPDYRYEHVEIDGVHFNLKLRQ